MYTTQRIKLVSVAHKLVQEHVRFGSVGEADHIDHQAVLAVFAFYGKRGVR